MSDEDDLEDYENLSRELHSNNESSGEPERKSETDLSRINRILIGSYGVKSAEQVAEETGLPAGEIAKRRQELLSSIDILDIQARRVKLMLQLESMVAEVESRMKDVGDRNLAPMLNSAGSNLGRVLKELERAEKASQVDIEAINKRRGAELTRIIEKSFDRMLGTLQERYPEVPQEDIESEFQSRIKEVAREYDQDTQ